MGGPWDLIETINEKLGDAGAFIGNTIGGNSQEITIPTQPAQTTNTDPTISNGYIRGPSDMEVSQQQTPTLYTTTPQEESLAARVQSILGISKADATILVRSASQGNAQAIKTLQNLGLWPGGESGSGGGSGGGGSAGRVLFPEEVAQLQAETDRILAQTGIYQGQSRQINALFDPAYPDGALITLPDGTQRINGTEIIIDSRVRGDFKPVSNAPGYFVDPVTGTVIDTNGNQIRREELQETIRSNQAQETLQNNRLALDTELGITGLNQNAAISENEMALKSGLETNKLNLDSFLGTGNLNIGATNAETGRMNALTGRTSAAGELSLNKQQLDDARVARVIELAANPQNFVQREYETRALQAPAGIDSPAYRENTAAAQAIAQLLTVPDVDSLLPTYNAPNYSQPVLPNASIPRATAPTYQTAPTAAPASSAPAPVNNTPATTQQASDHFRAAGVPDWALAPLGYAEGTAGTKEREFIAGDPQANGLPNPEVIEVNNPAPDTSVSVTPIQDMAGSHMMPDGQQMADNQMPGGMDIQALVDSIVSEVLERLGGLGEQSPIEGEPMSQYAYGTDWGNWNQNNNNNQQTNGQLANNLMTKFNSPTNPVRNLNIPPRSLSEPVVLAPDTAPSSNPNRLTRPGLNRPSQEANNNFPGPVNEYSNQQTQQVQPVQQPQIDWPGLLANIQQNLQNRFSGNPQVMEWINSRIPNNNNEATIQPIAPNNNPWNIDLSSLNLPMFATGTADSNHWAEQWRRAVEGQGQSTSTPTSTNQPNNNRFGSQDSQGNYLGKLTSNTDQSIQNMPNVQYAKNYANQTDYNQLGTGNVGAAFGVNLPDVGGLNLRQLNDIQLDPDAWGTLSSLYSSGNRNLQAIYNRVLANAPRGNALTSNTMIRT